ncbi:MAG: hypothetical protein D6820_17770, partial [Lentisphaerae bacterium]
AEAISGFSADRWLWKNVRMNRTYAWIEVPSVGVHTLNVWMREDGFRLDRIALRRENDGSGLWGKGPAGSGLWNGFNAAGDGLAGEHTILYERYDGIAGNTVASLRGDARYPTSPSWTGLLGQAMTALNAADRYGSRMSMFVSLPQVVDVLRQRLQSVGGTHGVERELLGIGGFAITGDDGSRLLMSTTGRMADLREIASVPGYTRPDQWDKYGSQQYRFTPGEELGERVLLVAEQKENTGGDFLQVGVICRILPVKHVRVANGDGTWTEVLEKGEEESLIVTLDGSMVESVVASLPERPSGLECSGKSAQMVELKWNETLPGTYAYLIYRDGVYIGTSLRPSYTDWGLSAQQAYTYTVRSLSRDGRMSEPSAALTVTTPAPPPPGQGTGLTGSYFNDEEFSSRVLVRVDEGIDFDWKRAAPVTGVNPDHFSVRWEGEVEPAYSETITFYVRSDDGVRLWVDNQLLINNWQRQSAREVSAAIALEAGRRYPIRLEYFEATGDATVSLSWSGRSFAKEVIPAHRLYPSAWSEGNGVWLRDMTRSRVSPVWLEGRNGVDAASLSCRIDGVEVPAAVQRLDASHFYLNHTAAASLGVDLHVDRAVKIQVNSADQQLSRQIEWEPTDLAQPGTYTLRRGDSLLLTVSGNGAVSIDADGDGTYELHGEAGERFPVCFAQAGHFKIGVKRDGVELAASEVDVVGLTLPQTPAGCLEGYSRSLPLTVTPATAAQQIRLMAAVAGPNRLYTQVGVQSGNLTCELTGAGRGVGRIAARLGGREGPVLGFMTTHNFAVEFINRAQAPVMKTWNDGEVLVASSLRIVPVFAGHRFKLRVITSTPIFEETGTKELWLDTSSANAAGYLTYYVLTTENRHACHTTGEVSDVQP